MSETTAETVLDDHWTVVVDSEGYRSIRVKSGAEQIEALDRAGFVIVEKNPDPLGVTWCTLHHGVINEDTDVCDMWDPWEGDPKLLNEHKEPLDCVPHHLHLGGPVGGDNE